MNNHRKYVRCLVGMIATVLLGLALYAGNLAYLFNENHMRDAMVDHASNFDPTTALDQARNNGKTQDVVSARPVDVQGSDGMPTQVVAVAISGEGSSLGLVAATEKGVIRFESHPYDDSGKIRQNRWDLVGTVQTRSK